MILPLTLTVALLHSALSGHPILPNPNFKLCVHLGRLLMGARHSYNPNFKLCVHLVFGPRPVDTQNPTVSSTLTMIVTLTLTLTLILTPRRC